MKFGRDRAPSIKQSGARMTMSMSAYLAKYSLISFVGILLALIQTAFFGRVRLFGTTPDLIFMYVFAVGFLDGIIPGSIAAVAGGFFYDALGSDGASPIIFFYLVTVVAACLITESRIAQNLPAWIITTACACTLKALYSLLLVSTISMSYSIIDLFGNTIIPEFFATEIASIPIFFLVRKITNSF